MNLLITGGTGFLGKSLLKELIENKDFGHIYILAQQGSLKKISHLSLDGRFVILQGNLISLPSFPSQIDVVIHAAARGSRFDKKSGFDRVNRQGTQNLTEALKNHKVKKFIYISSNMANKKNPDAYGISKKESEEIVSYWAKSEGADFYILRSSMIYGPESRPNSGITQFVDDALSGKGIYLKIDWPGECCLIYVDDYAKIILSMVSSHTPSGIYGISDGNIYRLGMVFSKILEVCKIKSPLFKLPDAAWKGILAVSSIVFKGARYHQIASLLGKELKVDDPLFNSILTDSRMTSLEDGLFSVYRWLQSKSGKIRDEEIVYHRS